MVRISRATSKVRLSVQIHSRGIGVGTVGGIEKMNKGFLHASAGAD